MTAKKKHINLALKQKRCTFADNYASVADSHAASRYRCLGKKTSKNNITNFNQNKQTTMVQRMKTAGILLASSVLATISFTTSCADYDNGFDEATIRYNQSFIDRYGKPDPNHDWGFGEIGSIDETGGVN